MATNKIETKEVEKDSKQYIVVQIGNEKYGIDICYVDNIVRMQFQKHRFILRELLTFVVKLFL